MSKLFFEMLYNNVHDRMLMYFFEQSVCRFVFFVIVSRRNEPDTRE